MKTKNHRLVAKCSSGGTFVIPVKSILCKSNNFGSWGRKGWWLVQWFEFSFTLCTNMPRSWVHGPARGGGAVLLYLLFLSFLDNRRYPERKLLPFYEPQLWTKLWDTKGKLLVRSCCCWLNFPGLRLGKLRVTSISPLSSCLFFLCCCSISLGKCKPLKRASAADSLSRFKTYHPCFVKD